LIIHTFCFLVSFVLFAGRYFILFVLVDLFAFV
jgi:hypothetical protein